MVATSIDCPGVGAELAVGDAVAVATLGAERVGDGDALVPVHALIASASAITPARRNESSKANGVLTGVELQATLEA